MVITNINLGLKNCLAHCVLGACQVRGVMKPKAEITQKNKPGASRPVMQKSKTTFVWAGIFGKTRKSRQAQSLREITDQA